MFLEDLSCFFLFCQKSWLFKQHLPFVSSPKILISHEIPMFHEISRDFHRFILIFPGISWIFPLFFGGSSTFRPGPRSPKWWSSPLPAAVAGDAAKGAADGPCDAAGAAYGIHPGGGSGYQTYWYNVEPPSQKFIWKPHELQL